MICCSNKRSVRRRYLRTSNFLKWNSQLMASTRKWAKSKKCGPCILSWSSLIRIFLENPTLSWNSKEKIRMVLLLQFTRQWYGVNWQCTTVLHCLLYCLSVRQVIKNTLNPSWPPFNINSQVLCNSDPNRKIRVRYIVTNVWIIFPHTHTEDVV